MPLDLGGTRVTSIAVGAYDRLLRHFGPRRSLHPEVMDVWQMLAWVEQPVVEALGIDVLPVPRLVQDFGMRMDALGAVAAGRRWHAGADAGRL